MKEKTLAAIGIILLVLWLNRRREAVSVQITGAQPVDWWDVWEYTGGV